MLSEGKVPRAGLALTILVSSLLCGKAPAQPAAVSIVASRLARSEPLPVGGSNVVTGGLRFGNDAVSDDAIDGLVKRRTSIEGAAEASVTPAVFGMGGVFTDPEFQVVMRSLVTVRRGQRAKAEVIREFIYPTEFEPPEIPQDFGSDTLEVETTLGPDGYPTDLTLAPEDIEFEGFINYGSPIQTGATGSFGNLTRLNSAVTNWDGMTLGGGGLIRDVIALSDATDDEGEETVVATLESPPAGSPTEYSLEVTLPPLVTITSSPATPEFCGPLMDCIGIHFQLTRTAPGLESPLTVLVHYQGTADSGIDYPPLPALVTFAAGETLVSVTSEAIDDDLVEGDESIVAVIVDPPPIDPVAYRPLPGSESAAVVIIDNDGAPDRPVVTISTDAFPAKTGEPCPVCFVAPATFTLSRTGSLDLPLNVPVQTGGTATAGVDYPSLPEAFVIPAGQAEASFLLMALDDSQPEGPEVVEISIRPSPGIFNVGDPGRVSIVITDDDPGAPAERLDIVEPANGSAFASGLASIRVRALGIASWGEIDRPVAFYANGELIGESDPLIFDRPPIPFLPRVHEIEWLTPADGAFVLTARVQISINTWAEAPPVTVTVGEVAPRPMVSIVATEPIAEERSDPALRPFVLKGVFTISRTGPLAADLPVFLHVSGTALPDADYGALPIMVTIPAGEPAVTVTVEAIPDSLVEPLESVIAEVSNCPPFPIRAPCYDFDIDPAHHRDTVYIRDDGITRASIEITAPAEGAHFTPGEAITIDALALDIDGAITAVDSFAGDQLIGHSEIIFIVAPEPGTPIAHSFTWTNAPAGRHSLTVRGRAASGDSVVSTRVVITVGGNEPPEVVITSPADGGQFPSGSPIEMVASATDSDGYVHRAEFFANGQKLGEVSLNFLVPPPPGGTQSFSFVWHDAPPGSHALSVRVHDDAGAKAIAGPVTIVVTAPDGLPVVVVFPSDPFAVEPTSGQPANPASMRLRRYGSTAADLAVNYSLGGTATNGTDYTGPTGFAVFPAGSASVTIVIEPLADEMEERFESVVLQVEPQFDDGPQRYHVGARHRAIAVIADSPWPSATGPTCTALGDGLIDLCFPAAPTAGFRIEATDDLFRWETVHSGTAPEPIGDVHFIDPDSPTRRHRFYRLVPDSAGISP